MKTSAPWGLVLAALLWPIPSSAQQNKITALNPLGQPPLLKLVQIAPRPSTIEGKTIYIVDVQYPETRPFFDEMLKLLTQEYPKTKWVMKKKMGSYFEDDPELWKEIKAKGDGMIIAIGH